jgi:hypothetical protein
MKWPPDRRDDLRERRRRLRQLDVLLLAEIDFFGSVSLREFTDAAVDGPETDHLRLSNETIREWWEDAVIRRLLDEIEIGEVQRCALSGRGTQRLDAARAKDVLDHRPMLHALIRLIRFVLPSAAAATAIVTLAEKQTDILIYASIIAGGIAGGLLGAAALAFAARPLWGKLVRFRVRQNAHWLEGRLVEVSLLRWTLLAPRQPRRLPNLCRGPGSDRTLD